MLLADISLSLGGGDGLCGMRQKCCSQNLWSQHGAILRNVLSEPTWLLVGY